MERKFFSPRNVFFFQATIFSSIIPDKNTNIKTKQQLFYEPQMKATWQLQHCCPQFLRLNWTSSNEGAVKAMP